MRKLPYVGRVPLMTKPCLPRL